MKLVVAGAAAIAIAIVLVVLLADDGSSPADPSNAADVAVALPDTPPEGIRAGIIGGEPTSIEDYPWQVAIAISPEFRRGNEMRRYWCGGVLLSPTVVISAAHCFNIDGEWVRADAFTVISGRSTLTSDGGRETPISGYEPLNNAGGEPRYRARAQAWDVVLITLPEPAIGTPVQIAGPSEADTWEVGDVGLVSGWGSTDDGREGTSPNRLRATTVDVLAEERCSRVYGGYHRTSLCAGAELGDRDTCFGDSGGPMVVKSETGLTRLIGTTSYGHATDCANARFPGVYARVADEPLRSAIEAAVLQLDPGVDVTG